MKCLRVLMLLLLARPPLQTKTSRIFAQFVRTFGAGVSLDRAQRLERADLEFRVYASTIRCSSSSSWKTPRIRRRAPVHRINPPCWNAYTSGSTPATGIRRGLRNQFTESPSAHLGNAFAARPSRRSAPARTQYAKLPCSMRSNL